MFLSVLYVRLSLCLLNLSLSLWAQANVLPVCPGRRAGQRLGDHAGVFWRAAGLPGHQGRVQTPTQPRGGVTVCPLQDSNRGGVTHHALTSRLTSDASASRGHGLRPAFRLGSCAVNTKS